MRATRDRARPTSLRALLGASVLCAAIIPMASAQKLKTELVTDEVSLPTWVGQAPGDPDRIFILERTSGRIRIFKDGQVLGQPFLDIRDHLRAQGDGGFMSMAFHPDFVNNKLFYIFYTNENGDAVVDRYQVSADPDLADASSRFQIIKVLRNPDDNLHAGGFIGFSPTDHYLYITNGDAGPQGDPDNHAQDPQLLNGKILRIDVDGGSPYAIPPDNPFVDDPDTLDEIWAIGFRNPWRAAFDARTGDLYVGDVGFGTWEEVDFLANGDGGRNYGWPIKEGHACYRPRNNCDPNGLLTDPITDYMHITDPRRCAIIGGVVYRGKSIPLLDGWYFFTDYCSAEMFSIRYNGQRIIASHDYSQEIRRPNGDRFDAPSSFGTDLKGEVYVVDLLSGVYRVVTKMQIAVPDLFAGAGANIDLTGLTPDANALVLYSTVGTGPTQVVQYGITLALRQPHVAGMVRSDAQGNATFTAHIPQNAAGRTIWIQAAENGNTSNVVRRTVR